MSPREEFLTKGLEGAPSNDIGWHFGTPVPNARGSTSCKLCGKVVKGGITRFKEHIAHKTGNVAPCPNVTGKQLEKASNHNMSGIEEKNSDEVLVVGVIFMKKGDLPMYQLEDIVKKEQVNTSRVSLSLPYEELHLNWLEVQAQNNQSKGTVFWKSMDVSSVRSRDAEFYYNLLDSVVEEIGESYIVQIVTDNEAAMKGAGKKRMLKRKHLYWTSCATHCLDLCLKDIGKRPSVAKVLEEAKKVTCFIYNHIWTVDHICNSFHPARRDNKTKASCYYFEINMRHSMMKRMLMNLNNKNLAHSSSSATPSQSGDGLDGGGLSPIDDDDDDNGGGGRDEIRSSSRYGREYGVGTTSGHFRDRLEFGGNISPKARRDRSELKAPSKGKCKKHTSVGSSSSRRSSSSNLGQGDSSTSTQDFYPPEQFPYFQPSHGYPQPYGYYPSFSSYGVPYQPQMYHPPPMYQPPPPLMYPPQIYPPHQLYENQGENVTFLDMFLDKGHENQVKKALKTKVKDLNFLVISLIVAADYFALGYFVWAVLMANLAWIGYEEKTMYMAAYDWRLSFQITEVRDQTLSRIKSNIELLVATNGGRKVVAIPHSMGVLYFLHFMKWVEAPAPMGAGGGPDWCSKHIKAGINNGGPFLGVPKPIAGLFSAEAKDIAVARALAPGFLDNDIFQFQTLQHVMKMSWTWHSTMSMIPRGGDTIWGDLHWSPEEGYSCSKKREKQNDTRITDQSGAENAVCKARSPNYGRLISFGKDVAEVHSSDIERIDFRGAIKAPKMMAPGTAHFSYGIADNLDDPQYKHYKYWSNPLETTLPNAPDMEIFSMYGVGLPTERAYVYKLSPLAERSIPFKIDTSADDEATCPSDGVYSVDGDETVPVLSAGFMCAKGWRGKTRFNPSGIQTYVREYNHSPPANLLEGRGTLSGAHVDIMGNFALIEDVIRIAAGASGKELGGDQVYSKIFNWSKKINLELTTRLRYIHPGDSTY
ncbi:putative phospholipid:diacylglycerol acyltransferase 2 [Hibiscus syriacus]|uniref:Phospholipid:diacylglycerol acyltransferase 2 n=1 Tax=Hibiscus syriacus TaxID=106335 RepID=A0A6A2ZFK4_HIBSY|nr:putative phospholipid:diacylglycerol acyltransferase 2 [Hibiscus syriacus]